MKTGGPNLPVNGPRGRQDTHQNPSIPSGNTQPSKVNMGPRDVSVHKTTGAALEGLEVKAGQHSPYVPIHKRDVVIEKVKGSFWNALLRTFSTAAMGFIRLGMGVLGNKANDQLDSNKKFAGENRKKLQTFMAEMKSIQVKQNKLRQKLPHLKPDEQHQFAELQKRFFELRAELSRLELNFQGINQTEPLLEAWNKKIKKEMQDFLALIKEQMGPGLKLIHGLQHVFKKSEKGPSAGKVYHLNLGDMSTKLSTGAELKVQNVGVFIEQCSLSPTGELTLDIADIRADVSSMGASGEVEPMTLSGGIRIKMKPPASDYLHQALTGNIVKAPMHLYGLHKALKPVFDGMFTNPPKSRFSDVAEVSVKSLQLEKKDGQTMALQDAPFAHSLIDLVIPLMSGSSKPPLAALEAEKQWKHKGLEVVCENLAKEEKERNDDLGQLREDMKRMPEGEAKDRCQQMDHQAASELEMVAKEKAVKSRELMFSKQARDVQQKRLKDIESYVEMNRVLIDLVYGLAAVANANPAGLQKHFDIPEMNIPVSNTCSVDLNQLKINVSDFSFSERGVVELSIPEMASDITVQNEATGEKRSVPVIARGAAIKIRPPYGPLVKELLQLKFPVDSNTLEKVVMPIYRETAKKKHSGGAQISDYLEIDLGTVSCLTRQGEVNFSAEKDSQYQQRSEEFVKKTGDLLSNDVDAVEMASALASAGLTQESQQKVWKLCEEGVFADPVVFAPEKLQHLVLPLSQNESQQEPQQERVDEPVQDEAGEGYNSSTSLDSLEDEPSVSRSSSLPEVEVPLNREVTSPFSKPKSPENSTPNAEVSKPDPVVTTSMDSTFSIDSTLSIDSVPTDDTLSIDSVPTNPEPPQNVMARSSVFEPERLQSTTVNARITDAVTPPSSSLPEKVEASKVEASKVETPKAEEAPVRKPLSQAVVQPATEKSPEALKFNDLKDCVGVINPQFRTKDGKRMADFEMRIAPQSLMKKLSLWMSFFLGKKEMTVQVVLPIVGKGSRLQLQSPSVQLKKQDSYNPAVWLATFVFNRRLRKMQYQLELDQVEQQKRLSLTQKSLDSPA
ncbi:hypothetical protein [Endozoicomonas sp. ONNA1]|uniref:hypothetical protein n=1 Tax=Endozoicomonas sp. ONNA1 TaxID=2828740 RepID=UPI0021498AE3|nr:hypothetical protein [Endozoicomonas sp. ONNA1]